MNDKTDPIAVHNSVIVIDTHADTPQRFVDEDWNFTDPLEGGMLNYDSAKKGNLDAQFFSIWVDPSQYDAGASARRTFSLIDATLDQIRRAPDKLQLCTTADDILAAKKQGRFAVLMGIEGGHSIEDSLALLRDYYRLGVRYMTLTWSNTNNWADSSGDIDDPAITHHNGLTPFGKEVRFLRRHRRSGDPPSQWPDTLRQGSRPRDEPAWNDGRHLPCFRQNVLGHDRHFSHSNHCLTLLRPRINPRYAKPDRRDAFCDERE